MIKDIQVYFTDIHKMKFIALAKSNKFDLYKQDNAGVGTDFDLHFIGYGERHILGVIELEKYYVLVNYTTKNDKFDQLVKDFFDIANVSMPEANLRSEVEIRTDIEVQLGLLSYSKSENNIDEINNCKKKLQQLHSELNQL